VRVARVIAKLEPGGAQLAAIRLTKALRDLGVESELHAGTATDAGRRLCERQGVEVEVWGGRGDLQYGCRRSFADWLWPRLAGADLVHAHMFGAWWAAAHAVGPRTPLVASEHNAVRWPGRPRTSEMTNALRRIDLFFAHGPAARRLVIALGLPAERLREGRSAVTVTDGTRPLPGLETPRLVYAGRLHEEKGPDVLIEALARLERPLPLYVLGTGPLEAELRSRANELGLGKRVRFAGWQHDAAPWIAGAAACIVPSRHDAWSQTAVQAMALGVPVVGSSVEGLPEVLGERRGILVSPEDPNALAAGIDALLAGRRRPDLKAARAYAGRFQPQEVAATYALEYEALFTPPAASAPVAA
jgi:glycosyltransferase involved in cell wall biosynthesis